MGTLDAGGVSACVGAAPADPGATVSPVAAHAATIKAHDARGHPILLFPISRSFPHQPEFKLEEGG
ncbi:hypothetical protein [Nitrospirillum amazonense]|uniref:hypothetical protein n=1 Tax=Nitrospirillum amazonense TaxID=28077 RepID=UPI00164657FB|nr:hypothetical protein [Nitrospirillum amazonense]